MRLFWHFAMLVNYPPFISYIAPSYNIYIKLQSVIRKVWQWLSRVTGGELFDRIVEKGSYSEKDAADLIKQVTFYTQTCSSFLDLYLNYAYCTAGFLGIFFNFLAFNLYSFLGFFSIQLDSILAAMLLFIFNLPTYLLPSYLQYRT
jgi:hypothetical protein